MEVGSTLGYHQRLGGERSPGRIELRPIGHDRAGSRTRQRRKASRSTVRLARREARNWKRNRTERGVGADGTARRQRPQRWGAAAVGGNSSRGVMCVAGNASGIQEPLVSNRPFQEPESRKRDEPQDRQRDATSPHPPGGGSRRGGAKPRGRNASGAGKLPIEARGNARGRGRPDGSMEGSLKSRKRTVEAIRPERQVRLRR